MPEWIHARQAGPHSDQRMIARILGPRHDLGHWASSQGRHGHLDSLRSRPLDHGEIHDQPDTLVRTHVALAPVGKAWRTGRPRSADQIREGLEHDEIDPAALRLCADGVVLAVGADIRLDGHGSGVVPRDLALRIVRGRVERAGQTLADQTIREDDIDPDLTESNPPRSRFRAHRSSLLSSLFIISAHC